MTKQTEAMVSAAAGASRPREESTHERLSMMLESITDCIFSLDRQWRFTYVNQAAERVLRKSRAELLGQSIWAMFPEAVGSRFQREYGQALQRGATAQFEEFYPPLDCWFEVRAYPSAEGLAVYFRDVTERKRAQEEILRAKQEWERTFDSVPDLIAILDTEHRIVRINRAMAKRLRQTPEQCLGLNCYQCVHGQSRPPEICPHVLTLQDGQEHVAELYEERLGGYFQVSTTPLFDERGQVLGSVHVARDITERKRMEEDLRQVYRRLSAIFDHTHMLVACLDREFNFLVVNRAFAQADGRSPEFFPGKNHFALYPNTDNEAIFRQVVETGKPYFVYGKAFDYAEHPERGTSFWDWSLIPIKDETGQVTQLVMTLADVTKPKLDEAALRQAKAQLAQANEALERRVQERTAQLERANAGLQTQIAERQRAEQALRETVTDLEAFCYSVSHDLRAPLRSMRGFSNLLLEECQGLSAQANDYASRIAKSAQRLDNLIQDLLAYSRVSRDELALKPVDAARLLREVIETYPDFQASRADFRLEGEFPLLLANEAALTQCCSNLLSNAVKFVPAGTRPNVRIRAEPKGALVRLWFEDNGIGIPKEHKAKIFGIFERLHSHYEGTGIGLSIVRKAIERMGGAVGVESEPGRGSRFWMELKSAPAAEAG